MTNEQFRTLVCLAGTFLATRLYIAVLELLYYFWKGKL